LKLLHIISLLLVLPLSSARLAVADTELTPTEVVADTMEARTQACIGCHGSLGRGVENVYFPRLAGKPAGYLYNQLVAFRNGTRRYTPMNYLLAYLPDPYLKQMADYFARQNPPLPPSVPAAVSATVLAQGRRITEQGIAERHVPACSACHGAQLGGREPGIPGLLGLRADYISAQLGAWRYGTRSALAPDCMQVIASSMSEADVAAVAAFLAAQPAVTPQRPIAASKALPLACGSQRTTSAP
jgi:cytochrome c553